MTSAVASASADDAVVSGLSVLSVVVVVIVVSLGIFPVFLIISVDCVRITHCFCLVGTVYDRKK